MKKNNNKGFTLIELLVVVAIIGILAAVGVTAYSGYTKSAKAQAAKTNHASIAKYIAAETTKCELGETTVMAGNLVCADRDEADKVNAAVVLALADFSNPFRTQDPAIVAGAVVDCDEGSTAATHSLGRTYVTNATGGIVTISTCWQEADTTTSPPLLEQTMTNTFRVDGN